MPRWGDYAIVKAKAAPMFPTYRSPDCSTKLAVAEGRVGRFRAPVARDGLSRPLFAAAGGPRTWRPAIPPRPRSRRHDRARSAGITPAPDPNHFFCRTDERLEQLLANGRQNARPRVRNPDQHRLPVHTFGNVDGAASRHRLERIADQIQEDALHAGALDWRLDLFAGLEGYGHALGFGRGRRDLAAACTTSRRLQISAAFALAPGDIHQVLQQLLDAARGA